MSRTAVIHQPDFMSYLGFFHRFLHADVFVVLDTAQYVNGSAQSWMNRDKIKAPQGERWLTVSVERAPRETAIRDIRLATHVDWRSANLNLLRESYRQAPAFRDIFPHVEGLYARPCETLAAFNLASIDMLMGLFDLQIETVLASDLAPAGRKNELLVDILGKVGADRYLSGQGARAYFEPEPFERAGIEVLWQAFEHPAYPQLHGPFVPYLSSIDLLFNCGIAESRRILRDSK